MYYTKQAVTKSLYTIFMAVFMGACTIGAGNKGVSVSKEFGNDTYAQDTPQGVQEVIKGTITAKRQVQIEADGETGQIIGMIVGATAGSTVGGGDNENAVGLVVGALAGMAVGKKIHQKIVKKTATEYIIEKDNKSLMAVIAYDDTFLIDHKVLVVMSNPPTIRFQ